MKMKKVSVFLLMGAMLVVNATSAFAAGGEASASASSVGKERAAWGYSTITYATDGSYGKASSSTYAGSCYYMSAKVTSTYSNGLANGPSDFASGNNTPSVETQKVYENGAYRKYTADGVFQDTSTSGKQYANVSSPLFS